MTGDRLGENLKNKQENKPTQIPKQTKTEQPKRA